MPWTRGSRALWSTYRPEHELHSDHERQPGEDQLQGALRNLVRGHHPDHDAERRERPDHQPVPNPDVAVAELSPDGDERHRNDRQQRRRLRLDLRLIEEDRERGHEEDPASHPEQATGQPARKAQDQGRDLAHGTISSTAITISRAAKRREITRSGTRCWTAVPTTTPAIAGTPTKAAFAGSTFPYAA